jgi:hypothetical protein
MPANILGNTVQAKKQALDLSALRWILNGDVAPVGGFSYVWFDGEAWADANNLKG